MRFENLGNLSRTHVLNPLGTHTWPTHGFIVTVSRRRSSLIPSRIDANVAGIVLIDHVIARSTMSLQIAH